MLQSSASTTGKPIRPDPFAPFGGNLQAVGAIDQRQAGLLAVAMLQAIKDSAVNISLYSVASAGLDIVYGIIKDKFGFFLKFPQFMVALANQDWDAIYDMIKGSMISAAGLDTLASMGETIQKVDNGRAAVALMKNPYYKMAISKQH